MSDPQNATDSRDLRDGIPLEDLVPGEPVFGRVDEERAYLISTGDRVRAFGAECTHYGAPLADGLVSGGLVRCPWHHARFCVVDGKLAGGPALDHLPRYAVEVRDGKAFVSGEAEEQDPLAAERGPAFQPGVVVIIGAGSAGTTAAETLRREGHDGRIVLVDPDSAAPYDRPNLSKAFLSGDAPAEWLPLRSKDFLSEHGIERVEDRAKSISLENREVALQRGATISYDFLLLATGSTARKLEVPGSGLPHVHTLRSLADCRSIIEAAEEAEHAVVIGASFIGMEVGAGLRSRGLGVTLVAPDDVPFERTLGPELGSRLQSLHEENGVAFRLGRTVTAFRNGEVLLDDDRVIQCDLIVVGVGASPAIDLARDGGLDVDDGILVDAQLRTSDPRVFAAGDVARFPDPRNGEPIRIEHWVVAGRQGRTAARNIMGREEPFVDAPFFWTRQFDQGVTYVGHAEDWDEVDRDGDCEEGDCAVAFMKHGNRYALATMGRSRQSLVAEVDWERSIAESRSQKPAD